jgi:predicted dehydrogenase
MSKDGMTYAPTSKPKPVVEKGEFRFAVAFLDHGHIYGQTNGLLEAGGELVSVYDTDPKRAAGFKERYPEAKIVSSYDEILSDDSVHLVAAAAIPCDRAQRGIQAMEAGKDYFTDKCPMTTLDQLAEARKVAGRTGKKYLVYYSERVHVESAWHAGELIKAGAIGDIIHINIMGPHRLGKAGRPDWFFKKDQYGGILTDIASHQCDQFLAYTGAKGGEVLSARVDNFANPDKPELEDFGEANFRLDNGTSCYSRVDWFTPDGLRTWGDGRSFIVGTKGYIEVRKYIDVTQESRDMVILVDGEKEHRMEVNGQVGFPFFGQLILDILNRTENAMTQDHAFMAAELSLRAQQIADASRLKA